MGGSWKQSRAKRLNADNIAACAAVFVLAEFDWLRLLCMGKSAGFGSKPRVHLSIQSELGLEGMGHHKADVQETVIAHLRCRRGQHEAGKIFALWRVL